ncbi:YncE family protein [Actinoplanes sp. CA-030573]|uniref:YncE family protein n=1 Tax=Actinoplanes sp. CA-030573 TaxID=3239898 RepID=UPI003D8B75CE
MTTRRKFLVLAGGAAAALAGGCTRPAPARPATAGDAVPDVVLADTEEGLAVLGGPRPGRPGTASAASADGRVVYAVTAGSELMRLDPAAGVTTRSATLGGGWLPRVVAAGGGACALSRTAAAPRPAARARTPLLVLTGGRQREYDLPGVVEPDAFTSDGAGLFVLEWTPAAAPERYRVRLLDLGGGTVGPLLTRDKTAVPPGAEETMSGEGRQQVASPDGQVLYTLYTHQPGHRHTRDLLSGRPGNAHAFVHVLHLTQRWAYCLDLPHPFGEGPAAGHAIAASADGREIAVLDTTSGSLAWAGTEALAISGVVRAPVATGGDGVAAADGGKGAAEASVAYLPDGGRVLVGAGRTVSSLDHTGTVTARWEMPGGVRGLAVKGSRVYVGGEGEMRWLDAGTGAVQGRAKVDGLVTVRSVR